MRRATAAAVCGVLVAVAAPQAKAESLQDALVSAYNTNPTLNAQRASLRATDEQVSQAWASFRPNLSGSAEYTHRDQQTRLKNPNTRLPGQRLDGNHDPRGYSVTLSQPVFRGFRNINGLREAEATVRAGRESLRTVEQTTLLSAVTAYMDVVRDQAIVRLQENNVKVLSEQLTATKDRFEVGEVTKTDVAQAEARRAGATSELSAAQGNLRSSRATYEQVIGHAPSNVFDPPPIDHVLPRTLPEALSVGDSENPDVLEALFLEEAAQYAVKQIIGETLPEVTFEAQFQENFDTSFTTRETEETTVTARMTVPLYSGGDPSSRARAARQTQAQRRREIDAARDRIRAEVVDAWSQLTAARAQIQSDEAQVDANRIALNGVREEEKVGQRTVLDVLDAEQEFLDSQVALVGTQRDKVVASYTLYSAVGRLDAANLSLPVQYYDPTEYYGEVRRKRFGFGPRDPDAR